MEEKHQSEIQLLLGHELTEDELRESCGFDDNDIGIGNQSQIDFILICKPGLEKVPNEVARNLHKGFSCKVLHTSFHGESKTIFIFWH
jgi:hypothetical protein